MKQGDTVFTTEQCGDGIATQVTHSTNQSNDSYGLTGHSNETRNKTGWTATGSFHRTWTATKGIFTKTYSGGNPAYYDDITTTVYAGDWTEPRTEHWGGTSSGTVNGVVTFTLVTTTTTGFSGYVVATTTSMRNVSCYTSSSVTRTTVSAGSSGNETVTVTEATTTTTVSNAEVTTTTTAESPASTFLINAVTELAHTLGMYEVGTVIRAAPGDKLWSFSQAPTPGKWTGYLSDCATTFDEHTFWPSYVVSSEITVPSNAPSASWTNPGFWGGSPLENPWANVSTTVPSYQEVTNDTLERQGTEGDMLPKKEVSENYLSGRLTEHPPESMETFTVVANNSYATKEISQTFTIPSSTHAMVTVDRGHNRSRVQAVVLADVTTAMAIKLPLPYGYREVDTECETYHGNAFRGIVTCYAFIGAGYEGGIQRVPPVGMQVFSSVGGGAPVGTNMNGPTPPIYYPFVSSVLEGVIVAVTFPATSVIQKDGASGETSWSYAWAESQMSWTSEKTVGPDSMESASGTYAPGLAGNTDGSFWNYVGGGIAGGYAPLSQYGVNVTYGAGPYHATDIYTDGSSNAYDGSRNDTQVISNPGVMHIETPKTRIVTWTTFNEFGWMPFNGFYIQ